MAYTRTVESRIQTAPVPVPPRTPTPPPGIVRSQIASFARVLGHPVLRRVLPGVLVSAIGDGMSLVAVAWLALRIAPAGQTGVWTGLAVAAYALPATVGAALFGRLVRRLNGALLLAADASLRAVGLGAIAVLAVLGLLTPAGYVSLLAASSLLHAWGNAGTYTLVAELLPDEDRVTANSVLSTLAQITVVIGPALAGGLTALAGPGWVIGADAVSFAVLAGSCWRVRSAHQRPTAIRPPTGPRAATGGRTSGATNGRTSGTPGGWHVILAHPQLLGLIAVTCVFFFLYGPVEVALPIHIARGLHGSPALLGLFWAVFGVGATFGGLAAGLLRHLPLWVIVVAIIIGWGAALLPLGLSGSVTSGLVGFAVGGMIYGPFTASCTGLFQRTCPPWVLSRVLATRTALTIPSAALGTLVGGPVVVAIGGQRTLLASALLTIAFGAMVAGMVWLSRARSGLVGRVVWWSGGWRYGWRSGAASAGRHPRR